MGFINADWTVSYQGKRRWVLLMLTGLCHIRGEMVGQNKTFFQHVFLFNLVVKLIIIEDKKCIDFSS